jgi:uncharacterized protein YbgA (DUF1722 family)
MAYSQNTSKITVPRAVVNSWTVDEWVDHFKRRLMDAMATMDRTGLSTLTSNSPNSYGAVMQRHDADWLQLSHTFRAQMAQFHTMGEFDQKAVMPAVQKWAGRLLGEIHAHQDDATRGGTTASNGALSRVVPRSF